MTRSRAPGDDRQAIRGREVRGDVCGVGCVCGGRRLQAQARGSGLGARQAPRDQCILGRCHQGVPALAQPQDGQDLSTADRGGVGVCGAGRARRRTIPGATTSARIRRTAMAAAASGTTSRRRRSVRSQPNAFGLYDMHGNVWEWVQDCWHDELPRRTDGRLRMVHLARIASPGPPRRFLGQLSTEPPLRHTASGSPPTTGTAAFGFRLARTISAELNQGRVSEAAEAWAAVKDTTSIPALEAFIARFPDTSYADLARTRIAELKKRVAIAEPPKPTLVRPAPLPRCDVEWWSPWGRTSASA